MPSIICWICDDNLAYQKYEGSKLLDESGNKPCLECIQESDTEEEASE